MLLHILAAAALATTPTHPAPSASDVVVSANWLRAHLGDRNLVLIDVRMPSMGADKFESGHIPGARQLDFHSTFVGDGNGNGGALTMEMPSVDSLRHVFERLGVNDASTIVLYGPSRMQTAIARTFVALDYVGLGARTRILDGGYDEWTQAGGATETATPSYAPGTIRAAAHPDVIAERAFVAAHLTDPGLTIVDARAPEFYSGSVKGHYSTRAGHVPGARNVYFGILADTVAHRYLAPDSARALFAAAGVSLKHPVVVYCHIGQTASVDYVQLRRLGVPVRLYDGAFEDWSHATDLPVSTGANP